MFCVLHLLTGYCQGCTALRSQSPIHWTLTLMIIKPLSTDNQQACEGQENMKKKKKWVIHTCCKDI